MKQRISISIVALLLLLALSCAMLTSCGGGIDREQAKADIDAFFTRIAAEDYEGAEAYLHPECYADLARYVSEQESRLGVDFSDGVTVERYTGISISMYTSDVGGSRLEYTMTLKVGNTSLSCSVAFAKNDAGYGIYDVIFET